MNSDARIFANFSRLDHTECQFCKAPYWTPHGSYRKAPCPKIVQTEWT